MTDEFGKGKMEALEELHRKKLLNESGEEFYDKIQVLKGDGWFKHCE